MYLEDYINVNDNDYDNDNDNEYNDYTEDILAEIKLDNKINIIDYYKNILLKDPDFIGLKNLSLIKFLNIIECTNSNYKKKSRLEKRNQHKITEEQFNIFYNIFIDLDINYNDNKLRNVIDSIFNIIYV